MTPALIPEYALETLGWLGAWGLVLLVVLFLCLILLPPRGRL